jgi:hypothetical protein
LNIQHLQAEINAIHQDTAQIDDSAGRAIVKRLLNLVERLAGAGTSPLSLAQFALVSSMFKVFFAKLAHRR